MSDSPAADSQLNPVYLLQNQDRLFLGKSQAWLDGRDLGALFRTPHKDEAVNQRVEVSARDYNQRIQLVLCPLNERGQPVIDPDILPPPLPKAPKTGALFVEEPGDDLLASQTENTSA